MESTEIDEPLVEVTDLPTAVPETDIQDGVQIASADVEEDADIQLGDRILLLGGRYNRTRGRIYYFDDDLIRILPDGLSDRLIDIPILEGAPDPSLKLEEIVVLNKTKVPSFVALADIRAGQIAETFSASGEPRASYTIKEVNTEEDSAVFVDETGDELPLQFGFRGIEKDAPFSVIRTQEKPKPVSEIEAPEPVADDLAGKELETEFEILEELEVPVFEEIQEVPTAFRVYPDIVQKTDMLQDLVKSLEPAQQKNMRRVLELRRLVESMTLLRNDITQYRSGGRRTRIKQPVFETLAELVEKTEFPLAKQVLSVAKSLYLDHSLKHTQDVAETGIGSDRLTSSDPHLQLNYLSDAIDSGLQYLDSQMATMGSSEAAETMVLANRLPRWHSIWQGYFDEHFKVLTAIANEDVKQTGVDKDFFRAEPPKNEDEAATLSGLPFLQDGIYHFGDQIRITPDYIGKVTMSYMRTISNRMGRFGQAKQLGVVEQGDEAETIAYILFPLLFIRDLGVIRSGKFSIDVGNGETAPKTMQMILEEGGGVSDIPSADGILAIRADGGSLGNIEVADWLKGQAIYGSGIADLLPYLRSFGMASSEFTSEQKEILGKKVDLYRASVRKMISDLRKVPESTAEVVNEKFLMDDTEFFKRIESEPILLASLAEFRSRYPAYAENDIARFSALYSQYADLLLSVLGSLNNVSGVAIERTRVVRDQFLGALREALALEKKLDAAGEAPTPNRCPHVESLSGIRKVQDDTDRIKLLIKFLNQFRADKHDHWIWCAVCNQHLLCEHEYLMIQEFLHPREKEVLHKQLLLTFSGGEFSGKFICKHCGQAIANIEYDTSLEYDDAGRPMMGRSVLEDKDALEDEELSKALTAEKEDEEKIDYKDEDKNLIYRTINQLANLLGVYPDRAAYDNMVMRVQAALATKPNRKRFTLIQKQASKAATNQGKKTPTAIDYDVYINRLLVTLSGAALLIDVQTHIPNYVIRYTLQGCSKPEFVGYPRDSEEDKTGLEYISCAIASIYSKDTPWALTGFQSVKSDKERQKAVAKLLEGSCRELAASADVQQEISKKKQYLREIFGSEAAEGRARDSIPDGFTPQQIVLPKAQAEAAEAPTVTETAGPEAKAKAWILTAHKLARQNGKYFAGATYAETACCYTTLGEPGSFWKSADLPSLPLKAPPRGPRGSILNVHMKPRQMENLFGKADASIYYRLFMRVCFQGPPSHIGLPHEPGYNKKCAYCGLIFPEDPRLPAPLPRFAKDGSTQKRYDEEYTTAIQEREQNQLGALQEQGIEVNKESFEDLLKETGRKFLVAPVRPSVVVLGLDLLTELSKITPEPFEGYEAIMNETITKVAALPQTAEKADMAIAFGGLSSIAEEFVDNLKKRLGNSFTAMEGLLSLSPQTLGESLRGYFLVPFQRVLSRIDLFKTIILQKSYKLSPATLNDIERALSTHVDHIYPMVSAMKDSPFVKSKVREVVDRLAIVLPIFTRKLRSNLIPAGTVGLEYIQRAIVAGIFSEFIDSNHVPPMDEGQVEAPVRAITAQATLPIKMFGRCLQKLGSEGLNFTTEQIRVMIAERNEKEKMKIVGDLDKMSKEAKAVELLNKKLGLGRWAVGGTKAIYAYDPEQYEKEKQERLAAGIIDYPAMEAIPTGRAIGADGLMDFGAEYEAEGGYDVVQTAEDDA
jgi:hypothetical protein